MRTGSSSTFPSGLRLQLQAGAHLVLYGARGTGKSATVDALRDDCRSLGVPCGGSPQTSSVSDIVAALAEAYPQANLTAVGKRAAGIELRVLARRAPSIILLDHATDLTAAMIGFLRRLRGGITGVLFVVDVDSDTERSRLRGWRRHAQFIPMPVLSTGRLRQMLESRCSNGSVSAIEGGAVRQLTRAARGRAGWVEECIRRLEMPEYWAGGRLHVAALCTDSEIALRLSRRGPRVPQFSRARYDRSPM